MMYKNELSHPELFFYLNIFIDIFFAQGQN